MYLSLCDVFLNPVLLQLLNDNSLTPWPLARKRTIPTERPPLGGEVSANFGGQRVSRGQRNGSPRPLFRFPRPFLKFSSLSYFEIL
jgi:hypothetical protein